MIWLIYCWVDRLEDDDSDFLPRVKKLARQTEDSGAEVQIERMDFIVGKRLRDQTTEKILELKSLSNLKKSDACVIAIPRTLLSGEEYLEEQAYSRDHIHDYPEGTFPCTGWMYF